LAPDHASPKLDVVNKSKRKELHMMGLNAPKLIAIGLTAAVLAVIPAGAGAQPTLDYSKNSVSGEYQPSPATPGVNHLDYSRNSVNGEDNAATPSSSAPTHVAGSSTPSVDWRSPDARAAANSNTSVPTAPASNSGGSGGFHWGDAGIGAGAIIVLTLVVGIAGTLLLGRRTRSRIAH
jgi:hypothetical protein